MKTAINSAAQTLTFTETQRSYLLSGVPIVLQYLEKGRHERAQRGKKGTHRGDVLISDALVPWCPVSPTVMCTKQVWWSEDDKFRMDLVWLGSHVPVPFHSSGERGSQVILKHLRACKVKSWGAEQDSKSPRSRQLRSGSRKGKQCQSQSLQLKQKPPPSWAPRQLWDFVSWSCTPCLARWEGIHTDNRARIGPWGKSWGACDPPPAFFFSENR